MTQKRLLKRVRKADQCLAAILPMIPSEPQRQAKKVVRRREDANQANLVNLTVAREAVAAETLPMIGRKPLKRGVKEVNRAVVEIVNSDAV
jgi:hypothetical protein